MGFRRCDVLFIFAKINFWKIYIFLQIDLEYMDLDYIQIATAVLRIRGYMIDISNGSQDSCLLL